MKTMVTLRPPEGRRLIARATVSLNMVKRALENGRIFLAGGTTNAYILEEITGEKVDKARYTAGIVTAGVHCSTQEEDRITPKYFYRGQEVKEPYPQLLNDFTHQDVVIKGGNAVDVRGDVGIMMANPQGGTIGFALGPILSRGIQLLLPVGLEKLIPSVRLAADVCGIHRIQHSYGMKVGIMPISYGQVITELEAFQILAQVDAYHVSSGGVGEMQGAVTLLLEGGEEDMKKALDIIDTVRGEPPIKGMKRPCKDCQQDCRNKEQT